MERKLQVELGRKILSALDEHRTSLADTVYANPVSDYISTEQAALEQQRLFGDYPLIMSLSCELPEPGDYVTNDFAGTPVLLVRGDDGKVNGFLNVCRHRGTKLCGASGKAQKTFVCPYHGWSYDRAGHLIGITDHRAFGDFDRTAHGLRRLQVSEKYGLIWVRPRLGEESIEPDLLLESLAPEVAAYGLDRYTHYETRVLRRRMNWKLVVDTFLEAYHIPILHRNTIAPILNGRTALFQPLGRNLRMLVSRTTIDQLRGVPEESWDFLKHVAAVYVLFPNVVLVWQGDRIETWRTYPAEDGTDASVMEVSLYTREPPATEKARAYWDRNMDLLLRTVEQEDFPLAEDMQRGFHSGAQEHITFGRNEPALAHFHKKIREALGLNPLVARGDGRLAVS